MNNPKDDVFSFLGRLFGSTFVKQTNFGQPHDNRNFYALLGILAFVGSEAVKIVFRKNFGMTRLAWVRYVLCILCFAIISAVSFYMVSSNYDFAKKSASPNAHLSSGIIFAVLAITVLIKGIKDANKNVNLHNDGDSNVLGFLRKEGWKLTTIQNFAEPMLTLLIGIFLLTYDYFGGSAIIFCAISSWLGVLFDKFFQPSSMEDDLNNLNNNHKRKAQYKKAQNA